MGEASTSSAGATPTLVVGVGYAMASAVAARQLVAALPSGSGMTFILIEDADREADPPPEFVAPPTSMPVVRAHTSVTLLPDHVYVIPVGTVASVVSGRLEPQPAPTPGAARSPIDELFRSLASEYGARSAGVVLSFGVAGDGAAGLGEIRGAAGLTIAHTDAGAVADGLSLGRRANLRTVDLLLPLDQMPKALERFVALTEISTTPAPGRPSHHEPRAFTDAELESVTSLVESQSGSNIDIYKAATIERRVLRRMVLAGVEKKDDYLARLRDDASECQALLGDLRIGVTEFFRDPGAFDAFRVNVVGSLLKHADSSGSVRVWVAGCATGEEAYSLVILLLEACKELESPPRLQVFATDVDGEALSVARAGVYADSASASIPRALLHEYFTRPERGKLQIQSRVRDVVSFATHDLSKDPPFSRMDLVSCRNVLMYLKPAVQHAVLRALHFALQPSGYLWIGTSEIANFEPRLFDEVSKKWRLYRKRGEAHRLGISRIVRRHGSPALHSVSARPPAARTQSPPPKSIGPQLDAMQLALMQAHVPPAVVISHEGEILYVHGDVHAYLRLPQGMAQRDLWTLCEPPLGTRIRTAGHKARRDQRVVTLRASLPSKPDGARNLQITVTPAPNVAEGALVIAFQPEELPAALPLAEADATAQTQLVDRLEQELWETREELRRMTSELEATSEELRISSEESSSIHEELQATNEELEATTEELRSLNEELTTVNGALKDKLAELELANDDLSNFFSSTRLATVFLDPDGRIRRFTPAAQDLLAILPNDVGRPVGDIACELLQADLPHEALRVLNELVPQSQDIETSDGRWVVRQVLPYRTGDRRTAGVVVTFQDVTDFKRTETLLRKREAQQVVISELGLKALETRNLGAYLDEVAQELQRMLGTDGCCILELQPGLGTSRLLLRAGLGWQPGLVGLATVPARANTEPSAMLRNREPTLVSDRSSQPRFEPHDLLSAHGFESCVSCVIHNDRGVYGLIGAYHRQKDFFGMDDATFLQALAHVVGSAVSACQTDLRAQLEQATTRLLSEPGDVAAISMRVLLQIAGVLGADICELWRKEAGVEQLYCECFEAPFDTESRERLRSELVPGTIQPGLGLVGKTWSDARAHWLASIDAGTERGRIRIGLGLNEGIAFPIVAGHHSIGVMAFFSRRHLSWDDQLLAMLDKIGKSLGAFATDRRAAFEQAHLAAIVASSDDAILSKDLTGIVRSWNPGAERVYGYSAAEMVGTTVSQLFPEHLKAESPAILERIASGERIQSHETVRIRKDGSQIDVSVTISPIRADDGRVVGASTIGRDITDKKRAEKRLAEADRQKDQFLAMLGHELRNPLAAVRNATELLKLQRESDPTTKKIREILDRQTRHMAHLMDGLLDVSRIIRNKIDLRFEPVDFGRVVREVVEDYATRSNKNSSQLHLHVEGDRSWVRGDSVRLTQIVDNLIGNAVKFTGPRGSIFLTLTERYHQVVFSVRDTGRGISPELLPHVFDVFRQAQQTLDRTSGGLGLGLALVKLLTELHGGTVEAVSEGEDRGAEFIVSIPAIQAPPKTEPPALEAGTGSFDILVVEDNRDAATLLCELLEVAGHATALAYSAEAAWERLQEHVPEVMLCDLGLPGDMTGFDLARRIRAEARFARMRIIALSGYGRPEDKIASRQAGFDAHLTKPVDFDSLQSILTQRAC